MSRWLANAADGGENILVLEKNQPRLPPHEPQIDANSGLRELRSGLRMGFSGFSRVGDRLWLAQEGTMKDTDQYPRILERSEPWFIADVELDPAGGRVDVLLKTVGVVATCGREQARRDYAEPRAWRHLNICYSSRPSSMPGFRAWPSSAGSVTTGIGNTSKLPSISSAAAWTFIPNKPAPGYPRRTRKDQ